VTASQHTEPMKPTCSTVIVVQIEQHCLLPSTECRYDLSVSPLRRLRGEKKRECLGARAGLKTRVFHVRSANTRTIPSEAGARRSAS
jgi:hypothetical protein